VIYYILSVILSAGAVTLPVLRKGDLLKTTPEQIEICTSSYSTPILAAINRIESGKVVWETAIVSCGQLTQYTPVDVFVLKSIGVPE
jgi:hypothetical protein